jgi:hypothetical protein
LSAAVRAAPYQFELLAERPRATGSLGGGLSSLPALNDNGVVAFSVHRVGGGTLDEIIYTGTPGNLRQVDMPGYVVYGGLSINNPGRIGFLGRAISDPIGGVHAVSPDGSVVMIAPGGTFTYETAISDGGAVMAVTDGPMFAASTVVVGDGTAPAQTVFRTKSPNPSFPIRYTQLYSPRMSGSGDWVATESGGANTAYTGIHTNFHSTYTDGPSTPPGTAWGSLGSADVARNGVLLFQGKLRSDPPRLYTSTAGGPSVAVPGSEGFGAGFVALNDDGVIALLDAGSDEASGTRLRLLRDGTTEKVLAQGDALFGSTVSAIGFDPKGFNNAEQFALLLRLEDGRNVYVLASPVPEPAAAGVGVVAWGLVALHRPRRRHV